MKLKEHEGKELFKRYGIAIPQGIVATSPEEAASAAKKLPGK